jgi:hypothetical protein
MGKYDEANVIRSLSKNPNIRITRNFVGKGVIEIKRGATTVGMVHGAKLTFCVTIVVIFMYLSKVV